MFVDYISSVEFGHTESEFGEHPVSNGAGILK